MPKAMIIRELGGSGDVYSCLENPMDRRAWQTVVHGVTELNRTEQLTHTQR